MLSKKQLFLFTMIIVIIMVFGYTFFKKSDNNNFVKIYDTEYYSIKYPADWKIVQKKGNYQVRFIPPNVDCRICGFQVLAFRTPFSVEQYTKTLISNMDFYKFEIQTNEMVKLNSFPAHKLIYTGLEAGEKYKWFRIYTVKDNILYDIGFIYNNNQFNQYQNIINKIIDSFKMKQKMNINDSNHKH
jgi:hypothetical protein